MIVLVLVYVKIYSISQDRGLSIRQEEGTKPMCRVVKDCFLRNVRIPLYGSIYIQSYLSTCVCAYPGNKRAHACACSLMQSDA
jgi:hypothetical protein